MPHSESIIEVPHRTASGSSGHCDGGWYQLAPLSSQIPLTRGRRLDDGFRAYAPSVATITINGIVYTLDTITNDPTAGIAVAIFDQNSFVPGRYGVGILQQPPLDGAGIIGDFASAAPDFTADAITPTVFTGYYGVGYGSGVCVDGTGAECSAFAVTPLVLHDAANKAFHLTLGNYDEDYPVIHDPTSPNILGPLNSASLVATPEPGTAELAGLSLIALLGFARRRRN